MKERPILLNDEMVRAILEGRKTQTRRIVKHKYPQLWGGGYYPTGKVLTGLKNQPGAFMEFRHETQDEAGYQGSPASALVPCPYGQPGDRLWVRETWSDVNLQGAPGIAYRADEDIRDLMSEPSFHDEDGAFNYDDERVKPFHFAVWSEDLLSGAEGRWRPPSTCPAGPAGSP